MVCSHLSSSSDDTKPNPEGVYRTRGYSLDDAMDHLKNDLMQHKDREDLKKLVATIQAKRAMNKERPGAKLVNKIRSRIEV